MSDLLVVGSGRLGLMVARQWLQSHPTARITLKFRTEKAERSRELELEGFSVISQEGGEICSAPLVVFCAPPTGNVHYARDIQSCVETNWSKTSPGSGLVFSSAGSVYSENCGGQVEEQSATQQTERSTPLLAGEQTVLGPGGCVLRLGGLYSQQTGPHNYWAKGGEFPSKPRGIINLLHYEDAARAVVKCLEQPEKIRGEIFLVSDGAPITRQEIASAAGVAGKVHFTGADDVDGKKYNTGKIRNTLGWQPIYPSLAAFFGKM